MKPKPFVFIILDGWGVRGNANYNAIAQAHTPFWDQMVASYPNTTITASGEAVGLPEGQMGNSEVGHMHLGAGRTIFQDISRIDQAIKEGDFFTNSTLTHALENFSPTNTVHLMGLVSPGGVHSHERHMVAAIKALKQKGVKSLAIHAFLDGRDTPPKSAEQSLTRIEDACKTAQLGSIKSLIGRYYAMDRDNRWERIEKAYNLLTKGKATYRVNHFKEALDITYHTDNKTDEFFQPTLIGEPTNIKAGDIVWFINFRADRARQLTKAFVSDNFNEFNRDKKIDLKHFLSMTPYQKELKTDVVFPHHPLKNVLGECFEKEKLHQLRIAETEKYAHVTFFFNGGLETPFKNETRKLIPSPNVATYDLQPEMNAQKVADGIIQAINEKEIDIIIANFANPDMIGHTGNFKATITAVETIDNCLKQITHEAKAVGGELLITADHGNAEKMFDENTHQPHTAHTTEQVPVLYIGRPAIVIKEKGSLTDIAPTLLTLMDLPIPQEMTGSTLFKLK